MQLQYMFHSVHATARCDHWTQPFNKYASSSALYPMLFIVLVFLMHSNVFETLSTQDTFIDFVPTSSLSKFYLSPSNQPCLVKG